MSSQYKDRCLTCNHWDGDKNQALKLIESSDGACMDITHGYAPDGKCQQMFEFIDIVVHGDAYAVIEFTASFGCIHHESDKEEK